MWLRILRMLTRGEVGCRALNDHGNYIIDHGKIMEKPWNFVLEISVGTLSTCSGFFFRSCKILFGLVKFMTAPDQMSGNVWKVFVNTATFDIQTNGNTHRYQCSL